MDVVAAVEALALAATAVVTMMAARAYHRLARREAEEFPGR